MSASSALYHIPNLQCAYTPIGGGAGRTVLALRNFTIPRHKMIFLLGRSGIGKSTILEALGLMNNTIAPGSELYFTPTEQERYHLAQIWQPQNKATLSKVRNNHFSFIFQETNLMPNFTVYENICFTQMLQGETYRSALEKVKKTMQEVGLSGIEEHKRVYELSGGQKQRVAFVRAITPRFSVLFGDEPTGNLDESNANELMSILRSNILSHNRTAVIVSHDINLATRFGDLIMLLSQKDDTGAVQNHHIFERQETTAAATPLWKNTQSSLAEQDLKALVRTVLKKGGETNL